MEEKPPPLSVLMSMRNGMPFVEQSVIGVIAQTFTDLFVIVESASTDWEGALKWSSAWPELGRESGFCSGN